MGERWRMAEQSRRRRASYRPSQAQYALNTHTKMVHRLPSREVCNVDDARKAGHLREAEAINIVVLIENGWALCEYCFGPQD